MTIIVKVPCINAMDKTKGCEKAPDAILQEMDEFYSNESFLNPKFDISEIQVDLKNLDETNNNIHKEAKKLFQEHENERVIFLGGDHSISYSLVKAFFETHKDAGLLVLDAHADCMHNFQPATHEDWLKTLIENGNIKAENVLLVGLRNLDEIEISFLNKNKVNSFSCKEIFNEGLQETTHAIMEILRKYKNLYLSLDIDIADPAFAPSVSYAEPGGLTSRELIYFIQKILLLKNLKAADIVEVNAADDNGLTTKLAAKIAKELL
ncbi:MAG: arginase family protein [Nanoarchaeota archaeon]|nr:arginase family protein [Nanoarchaeota archaeon]